MLIDLSSYIDKEIVILAQRFVKTHQWLREGFIYLSHKDKWPSITMIPDILYYSQDNRDVAIPWLGLKAVTLKDNLEEAIKIILDTLENIGIKPFMDEDAYKKYFTRPKYEENLVSVTCYVNTHYINGYWYNHTL